VETTDHYWRFKINVAPHSTAQFTVNEELPEVNAYQLSNLTPDQITRFISRRYLSPEMKQALENILDLKAQIAALGRQWQEKQQMITSVTKDQERMRENLRALGKSEEERKLVARYVARLSEGEDRIEQLRREEAQLGEQRRTLQHRLDDALRRLVLEHRVGT
jgi:septal ring factor EnvC (AmiA/AmiB activator)